MSNICGERRGCGFTTNKIRSSECRYKHRHLQSTRVVIEPLDDLGEGTDQRMSKGVQYYPYVSLKWKWVSIGNNDSLRVTYLQEHNSVSTVCKSKRNYDFISK